MFNTLSIATEGYISNSRSKTLTIATKGYIFIGDIIPPKPIPELRSGANKPRKFSSDINWLLKREDEEILTIINIFLKCKKNIKSF